MAELYTIGYEGLEQGQLISHLKSAQCELLLDVRYRAQSRKKGLSKTKLSLALAQEVIGYEHDRNMGTPPHMMKQKRLLGAYDLEAYRTYLLANHEEALKSAAQLAFDYTLCLLCYELDYRTCHRLIVAEELQRLTGYEIHHLRSPEG